MGRAPRIEYEGAVYHVMCRGNRQESVFRDNRDNEMFMDTLEEACGRCGWQVHSFVLMGNHYHLLLETPHANLVDGMRWLQGTYTKRFNIRHKVWGHLFQGRYKALLVDPAENYFQTVSSYIHLNPARAKRFDLKTGELADYKWSSYPQYLTPSKRPEWLVVERSLGNFGLKDNVAGRRAYEQIMKKRVVELANSDNPREAEAQWAEIRQGWCFGSDSFRAQMVESLDDVLSGKRRDSFVGEQTRQHDVFDAERWVTVGLQQMELKDTDLQLLKKGDLRKRVIAWAVRRNTSVRNEWIAKRLQMGRSSNLSRFVKEVEAASDGELYRLREMMK
ncbi:MAG: transposase [Kiritimatiellales bacterium]|nr:transposase [Kiritimatiellota bacterium]MBL7011814.1 transposase [Kiritimatiellales bacterium]